MEYIHEYENFADYPMELDLNELKKHYPRVLSNHKLGSQKAIVQNWDK